LGVPPPVGARVQERLPLLTAPCVVHPVIESAGPQPDDKHLSST
jgi:hypothetical protein